jgi:hypothetical protein
MLAGVRHRQSSLRSNANHNKDLESEMMLIAWYHAELLILLALGMLRALFFVLPPRANKCDQVGLVVGGATIG